MKRKKSERELISELLKLLHDDVCDYALYAFRTDRVKHVAIVVTAVNKEGGLFCRKGWQVEEEVYEQEKKKRRRSKNKGLFRRKE